MFFYFSFNSVCVVMSASNQVDYVKDMRDILVARNLCDDVIGIVFEIIGKNTPVPCSNKDCKSECFMRVSLDKGDEKFLTMGGVLTSINACKGAVQYPSESCTCEDLMNQKSVDICVMRLHSDPSRCIGRAAFSRGQSYIVYLKCAHDPWLSYEWLCCKCRSPPA